MGSLLGLIVLLAIVGALLHAAWHIMLAGLIWTPSAVSGISVGWAIATSTDDVGVGIGAAIVAAALVRVLVAHTLAWVWFYLTGGAHAR